MSRQTKKEGLTLISLLAGLAEHPLSPRTVVGITGEEVSRVYDKLVRHVKLRKEPIGERPTRMTHPSEPYTKYRERIVAYINRNIGIRPQVSSCISTRFYNVVADLIDGTLP